jgi:hypothetical protein
VVVVVVVVVIMMMIPISSTFSSTLPLITHSHSEHIPWYSLSQCGPSLPLADVPVRSTQLSRDHLADVAIQGALDAATVHRGVRVADAREVLLHSTAAATSMSVDDSGVVWVGVRCLHKGFPVAGASLHAATAADYKAYESGSRTFEGKRDVIGFVSNGQVRSGDGGGGCGGGGCCGGGCVWCEVVSGRS